MSGFINWLADLIDDIIQTVKRSQLLNKLILLIALLFLIGLIILILYTTLPIFTNLFIYIISYLSTNLIQIASAFIILLIMILIVKLEGIKYYNQEETNQLKKSFADLTQQHKREISNMVDELAKQRSFMTRISKSNDEDTIKLVNELNDIKNGFTNALSNQSVKNENFFSMFNDSDQTEPQTIFSIYKNIASEYSHTIKTPLSSIESTNEKIKVTVIEFLSKLPENEQKNFNILLESIENSSISIEYMYNILTEGAGFIPREPKKFSLQAMVRKAIRIVRESTKSDVKVLIHLENIPEVEYYWLNLFIALVQVIENAFEAVTETGKISIYGKQYFDEEEIEILITNDGFKIPKNLRENIFDKGISSKGDRRGSGLYIARRVLENIEGEIKLVKSNDYKTTFAIKFKPKSIEGSENESSTEPKPKPKPIIESKPKPTLEHHSEIIDFVL